MIELDLVHTYHYYKDIYTTVKIKALRTTIHYNLLLRFGGRAVWVKYIRCSWDLIRHKGIF